MKSLRQVTGTEAERAQWAKQRGGAWGIARSVRSTRLCEFPGSAALKKAAQRQKTVWQQTPWAFAIQTAFSFKRPLPRFVAIEGKRFSLSVLRAHRASYVTVTLALTEMLPVRMPAPATAASLATRSYVALA